jgi:hypothetical protein
MATPIEACLQAVVLNRNSAIGPYLKVAESASVERA